jgi:hypothetical protein
MTILEYLRQTKKYKDELFLSDIPNHFDKNCIILVVAKSYMHLKQTIDEMIKTYSPDKYRMINNQLDYGKCRLFFISNQTEYQQIMGFKPDYICEV